MTKPPFRASRLQLKRVHGAHDEKHNDAIALQEVLLE